MKHTHRIIPGSERRDFALGSRIRDTKINDTVDVTIALTLDSSINHAKALAVAAASHGLVSLAPPSPQSIRLSGTVQQIQQTFQVSLSDHESEGEIYRCRSGPVSVPMSFGSNVVAVMGLDNRPQAQHHHRIHAVDGITPLAPTNGYLTTTIASVYGFPAGNGAGRSVGIIELGGTYQPQAMRTAFRQSGIYTKPRVVVSGRQTKDYSATVEVMLDAEIVATLLPRGITHLYFGRNSTAGFYNALHSAIHGNHDAISISWGAPESAWTSASRTAFSGLAQTAGMLGITITAAAGDNGSSDGIAGLNVDFPASSPWILGCGGTQLETSGGVYMNESVWNADGYATGGGMSSAFTLPEYQLAVNAIMNHDNMQRMVPDVGANADPASGYRVWANSQVMSVGGTSGAAPLWAALICRLNAALGQRLGFIHPAIYSLPLESLRQITTGTNGAYSAGSPFNMCVGLGTPPIHLIELLSTGTSGQ